MRRRLPALLLDWLFLGIIIGAAVLVYSLAGGARLAPLARDTLGVPLTYSTIQSQEAWNEFEREVELMAAELEQQVREDFTDEQADFIARTMADAVESYFVPERISPQFVLQLDANLLDDIVDEAFDAVIVADRPDISAAEVNELRAEVKMVMDRLAIGQFVPAAIRFAVWLLLVPVIVVLAYFFPEAIWGRTLGKLALGIEVRAEGDGAAVPALMLRYAVKLAPFILAILTVATRMPVFLYLSGVSWVVIAIGSLVMIGPEKRALHDYVAGTAVYRR
ncbi:MAG: RDD family protein [Spirochaetota bacterium]